MALNVPYGVDVFLSLNHSIFKSNLGMFNLQVTSAYRKVKTGLDAVEKLAKQYPEVYRSIKDDIPDLEITLKSLYEDIMAIAADKEKGRVTSWE